MYGAQPKAQWNLLIKKCFQDQASFLFQINIRFSCGKNQASLPEHLLYLKLTRERSMDKFSVQR